MNRDDKRHDPPEGRLMLDDRGIPILDEVVAEWADGETADPNADLRQRLEEEMQRHLPQLAEQAARQAGARLIRDLEPLLRERLALLLEQQTALIIEQMLDPGQREGDE